MQIGVEHLLPGGSVNLGGLGEHAVEIEQARCHPVRQPEHAQTFRLHASNKSPAGPTTSTSAAHVRTATEGTLESMSTRRPTASLHDHLLKRTHAHRS
jgi:hypothetical protein